MPARESPRQPALHEKDTPCLRCKQGVSSVFALRQALPATPYRPAFNNISSTAIGLARSLLYIPCSLERQVLFPGFWAGFCGGRRGEGNNFARFWCKSFPNWCDAPIRGFIFEQMRHALAGRHVLIEREPERPSRHLNAPRVGRSNAANLLLFWLHRFAIALPQIRAAHPPDNACSCGGTNRFPIPADTQTAPFRGSAVRRRRPACAANPARGR